MRHGHMSPVEYYNEVVKTLGWTAKDLELPNLLSQVLRMKGSDLDMVVMAGLVLPLFAFGLGLTMCKTSRLIMAMALYAAGYTLMPAFMAITVLISLLFRKEGSVEVEGLRWRYVLMFMFAVSAMMFGYWMQWPLKLIVAIGVALMMLSVVMILPSIRYHSVRDFTGVVATVAGLSICAYVVLVVDTPGMDDFMLIWRGAGYYRTLPEGFRHRLLEAVEWKMAGAYMADIPENVRRNFFTPEEIGRLNLVTDWGTVTYWWAWLTAVSLQAMAIMMVISALTDSYGKHVEATKGDISLIVASRDYREVGAGVMRVMSMWTRPSWLVIIVLQIVMVFALYGSLAAVLATIWLIIAMLIALVVWEYAVAPALRLQGTNATRAPKGEVPVQMQECKYTFQAQANVLRSTAAVTSILMAIGLYGHVGILALAWIMVGLFLMFSFSERDWHKRSAKNTVLTGILVLSPGMVIQGCLQDRYQIRGIWYGS